MSKRQLLYNAENIDGGVELVNITCEEDYLIAMTFVAECFTFNKEVDLNIFNLNKQRNKIVDLILILL